MAPSPFSHPPSSRYNEDVLPLINPTSFLWFLLIAAAALLAGAVIFFFGILKGKEIEAGLQRRSQKISRSVLGGVFSEQVAHSFPTSPKT
jgi:hypothetical protein